MLTIQCKIIHDYNPKTCNLYVFVYIHSNRILADDHLRRCKFSKTIYQRGARLVQTHLPITLSFYIFTRDNRKRGCLKSSPEKRMTSASRLPWRGCNYCVQGLDLKFFPKALETLTSCNSWWTPNPRECVVVLLARLRRW